jgi:hypothetical protein
MLLLGGLWLMGASSMLWAEPPERGIFIHAASLVQEDGSTRLNADIDYRFNDAVVEALQNGVPLRLVLQFRARREQDFWPHENFLRKDWVYQIRYHSLAKLYQWIAEDGTLLRNFSRLETLLETMGRIRDLPLDEPKSSHPERGCRGSLRVFLDIEALPLPLRPMAYLSPDWTLTSNAYSWPCAN